jgi:hypothetical protein
MPPRVRLYPDVAGPRAGAVLRDALVLLLLCLFALLGIRVHDTVDQLAVLGRGVRDSGNAISGGFEAAADKVDDVPLVGGKVADGLRGAGEGSGGNVAELGESGENAVHRLANLLGLLVFGLPSAVLLARWLPERIERARRLTASSRVLADPADPERQRVIAMRAAFSMPFGQLLEYTRDPLGDLAAGRYDALVAAALDDAGLVAPTNPTPTR